MNLSSRIKTWLSTTKEDISIYFLTHDHNLINMLLSTISNNSNIQYIVLDKKFADSDYIQHESGKVITTTMYEENPGNFFTFIDFVDSLFIMGIQDKTYNKDIEYNKFFRSRCKSIMTYKYSGSNILSGYWKALESNIYPEIQCQILNISEWGRISQKLPKYTDVEINNVTIHNQDFSKAWIKSMKIFIDLFIREVLKDLNESDPEILNEIAEYYTSQESLIILTKAFTHVTVNAIYNYEDIEHHGDNLFRSSFSNYLHFTFERITNQASTGYQLQFLSSEYQSFWSDDLGLFHRMIKDSTVRPINKSKTDIIEAFFGALSFIGHSYQEGFNNLITEKVMYLISDSLTFDKDLIFGKAKQFVIQIGETLGFDANNITIKSSNSGHEKILEFVIQKSLLDFYTAKDIELSREDNSSRDNVKVTRIKLSKISNLRYSYDPLKMSKDNAENKFWGMIRDIYKINNLTFENVKLQDEIINVIQKYDSDTYSKLVSKIKEDYDLDEIDLAKLKFKSSIYEGYVILYISPSPNGEGFINKRSMSRYKPGERESNDYETQFKGIIQSRNLAVVKYVNTSSTLGSITLTANQTGKYNAIKLYAS